MLNPIQGIKHVNYTLDLLLYLVEQGKTCLACPGRQSMQPLGLLYTHPRQLLDDGDVQVLGIGSGVLHWACLSVMCPLPK